MNSKLSSDIKAEATRLGFFACGIAKAAPVREEVANIVRQWIENGENADMAYMGNYTDKRLDPRLLMPGVKSIVCVALNYTPEQTLPEGEYQFAAYALGQDYHDIVKNKLRQLATSLGFAEETASGEVVEGDEEKPRFRAFVDTAPVLERYWAEQAGLGWTGRNHQLIIPHAGSMFFLGELFLNIELSYDSPMPNHCGKCHACIDACPTKAIDTTGTFHAEKCLSYQLIENRGDISPEAQSTMGDTIYGCDRCQQACPWNRFAQPNNTPELQPREALLNMTREDWQHLSVEQYQKLFKGSAVKRAKYQGLMRNIEAASCNSKQKELPLTNNNNETNKSHKQ
jgi:epoxyqueuosine reductase